MKKYIGWFSCGTTSAVACKLALDMYGKENVDLWYIDTGAAHQDNKRFIEQCEKWYGVKIKTAKSQKYSCPLECAKKELFNTPYGSPCTLNMKKKVRQEQIMPLYADFEVWHILGFEYTQHEVNRALRWKEQQTKNCVFPLIYKHLTKKQCLLILKNEGIEIPAMYKLGYNNNNCIGCFKGGMGYWNKIRKDFPNVFEEVSKVEQETGHTCLKKDGQQLYLKDLKPDWGNHKDLEIPDCGLFCDIDMFGLKNKEIKDIEKLL